jgi:hypothetical protein
MNIFAKNDTGVPLRLVLTNLPERENLYCAYILAADPRKKVEGIEGRVMYDGVLHPRALHRHVLIASIAYDDAMIEVADYMGCVCEMSSDTDGDGHLKIRSLVQ